jgi:hypothetical protein
MKSQLTGQARQAGKPDLQGWAICLARRDAAAAGRLRQVAGAEVCELPETVWLRGPQANDELQRRLAAVAGARRFSVLPDGQLLPVGARVPQGRLPPGPWTALAQWIGMEPPPAVLAGKGGEKVSLALVRSDCVQETSLLCTRFELWAAYAVEAPQVRLDRWRFAVAADGRAVVHDQRQSRQAANLSRQVEKLPRQVEKLSYGLPPLPGQHWVEQEGIAVPAGWTWKPAVEAALVRQIFGLAAGDVALWHADGAWERIAAQEFVRATRAAVRETMRNLELRS